MADFKRTALQEFLVQTQGEPPPVFVGRDDILSKIEAEVRLAWKGPNAARHGRPKKTQVVLGAPGAGKTSLLHELRRRATANSGSGERRVLILNSNRVSRPVDVLGPLAELINPDKASAFLARYAQTKGSSVNAGLPGTGVTGTLAATTSRRAPHPDMTAFRTWADRLPAGKGLTGPVLIAIDEAQRFRDGPDTPLAKILQELHDMNPQEGPGLPFVLLLAGLGDTDDRASRMHLTRGDLPHAIGALEEPEIASAMIRFCKHFGMNPANVENELDRLASPCDGWPSHLHGALHALAKAALERGGALTRVDWIRVEEEAATFRNTYYQMQQSSELLGAPALVAAVLQDWQPDWRMPDAINSIARHTRSKNGAAWQLPEGYTPTTFYAHLLHRGVLHADKNKRLACPIPSFRTYLMAEGAEAPLASRSAPASASTPLT